jgi:integrase
MKWDTKISGLGLKQKKRGQVYILKYRVNGKQKYQTLGNLNLSEAREKALQILGNKKNLTPSNVTINYIGQRYLEEHSKLHKKSYRKDYEMFKNHISPAFGRDKLEELTVSRFYSYFQVLSKETPYTANRCKEFVSNLYNFSHRLELYNGANPTKGVPKNREMSRSRYASIEEMTRIIEQLKLWPCPTTAMVFMVLIHTGCRLSEILDLQWSDIDSEFNRITLHDTKNGETHFLPLLPEVRQIFDTLPKLSKWIFHSTVTGKQLREVGHAWKKICKKAEVENLRIHDLRRTVGSWLASQGVSENVIGKLLNHKSAQATKVYARMNLEPVSAALKQYTSVISYISSDDRLFNLDSLEFV